MTTRAYSTDANEGTSRVNGDTEGPNRRTDLCGVGVMSETDGE